VQSAAQFPPGATAYGNRLDRYNGGLRIRQGKGRCDGLPSIIQQARLLHAIDGLCTDFPKWGIGAKLAFRQQRRCEQQSGWPGRPLMHGCGHGRATAEQEIITGPLTIASDGKFQCHRRNRPWRCHARGRAGGWQGNFRVSQFTRARAGWIAHDGATCTYYFQHHRARDTGRGVAEYVSASDTTAATCSSSHGNVNCGTGGTSSGNAGSNSSSTGTPMKSARRYERDYAAREPTQPGPRRATAPSRPRQ